jgi:hypothetical protein
MSKLPVLFAAVFFTTCLGEALCPPAQAQVGISVTLAPPALPVYVQPPIPAPGYIWTPGYWAWDAASADYYWVPGTWVQPPSVGVLWTPGYWGWGAGGYLFHAGYWGPTVGFYGGINYGFGYGGVGYGGGYWSNGSFFYNKTVNNVSNTNVTNVYNKTVIANNTKNVSYNGGAGGTTAKPTPAELATAKQQHVAPTSEQQSHQQAAHSDKASFASQNHGQPAVAATAHPGDFKHATPTSHPDAKATAAPESSAKPAAAPLSNSHAPMERHVGQERPLHEQQVHPQPQMKQVHPQPQMQQVHPHPMMTGARRPPPGPHPQPQRRHP